jgi:hypothetical protein
VSAVTNFETLVKAKPRRDFDGRDTIVIGQRLHDTINAVIAVLIERDELLQYDGTLAVRSANGKKPIKVSVPWLRDHLRQQFNFKSAGKPVEMPPWLVKFRDGSLESISDFRFEASENEKKRKHRRRPGPRSL